MPRELELTLPQCKVLAHLSRNEGISQARLAELTETDPMTLVRTLDRMQQDQWIERRPDPADRRAHRLYLREAAKTDRSNRMWKIAEQARSEALSATDPAEREQLVDLLERVHEHAAGARGQVSARTWMPRCRRSRAADGQRRAAAPAPRAGARACAGR